MSDWERIGPVALSPELSVRRPGFGGVRLTGPGTYGPPPDPDGARRTLRRAVERGIQLIDTADCYGPEVSERLIAEALYPYPDEVVIATKGGRVALGDNRWQPDGRPEHLIEACEGSLRRLRLDTIELYQLNAVDPQVPLEESLGALTELREAGKIRHIGVCNVDCDQLYRCRAMTPVASVQDRYDFGDRLNEPVLEACTREGIAFLAWFPQVRRLPATAGSALARISRERAATPAQVALAWLLCRSPVCLPLPGTFDPRRLEEDLASVELELTPSELECLTAADDASGDAGQVVREEGLAPADPPSRLL